MAELLTPIVHAFEAGTLKLRRSAVVQNGQAAAAASKSDTRVVFAAVFSDCCARYRLLYDRPVFVVRITAARRYAASSVDFKAFVQGTRIKGASRPRCRALDATG